MSKNGTGAGNLENRHRMLWEQFIYKSPLCHMKSRATKNLHHISYFRRVVTRYVVSQKLCPESAEFGEHICGWLTASGL